MQINAAVKKLREVAGETQQAFATRLGISIRGLANYESNRVPPLVVLARLQQFVKELEGRAPETVRKAIDRSFLGELPKSIGARRGIVSFAFSHEGTGGLMFEILNTEEEYGYAHAFQYALRYLRSTNPAKQVEAKDALERFLESTKSLFEPGEFEFINKHVLGGS